MTRLELSFPTLRIIGASALLTPNVCENKVFGVADNMP
jgi:hypothetical protein